MNGKPEAIVLGILLLTLCGCANRTGDNITGRRKDEAASGNAPEDAFPLFQISENGKYGFMNSQGQIVISPQFDQASFFSEGLAAVCVGPCKFVKDNPREQISFEQTFQGKYGFVNSQGMLVINPRFTYVGDFHKGLAFAATGEYKLLHSALQIGYIDKSGAFVISEQFQSAGDFDDSGLAAVCVGAGDASRCGFIDATGKYVVNPQFYSAQAFKDGLAAVFETADSTASYIDRTGRVVWKGTKRQQIEK
jgi:hypothetical protein